MWMQDGVRLPEVPREFQGDLAIPFGRCLTQVGREYVIDVQYQVQHLGGVLGYWLPIEKPHPIIEEVKRLIQLKAILVISK
jgi:hypothetical protein